MSKKKLVIVDDSADDVMMLEFFLKNEGYEVFSALKADDAIRLAKEHKPDLVIIDIYMPETDGITLASKLKEDPETQNLRTLLLTAAKPWRYQEKLDALNLKTPIVEKSIAFQGLLTTIRQAIGDSASS